MSRLGPFLVLFAALVTAMPSASQILDTAKPGTPKTALTDMAKQVVESFDAYCIAAQGDRGIASSRLDRDGVVVKRVPDDFIARAQGASGGIGWELFVKDGPKMLLEFSPQNMCSIESWEVDADALRAEIKVLLDGKVKAEAAKYKTLNDEKNPMPGLDIRETGFMMAQPKAGTNALVIVSTLVGGQLDEQRGRLGFMLISDPYDDAPVQKK